MKLMIVVIIVSYLLSTMLNKIGEKKNWKSRAQEILKAKPKMRSLPTIIGVGGIACLIILPRLVSGVGIWFIAGLQVIVITAAVFLFELFREE